ERRNKDIMNQVNVYIDEFQILVPDTVTDLLEKSRASQMGITLAQQSLQQVMKNTNNGEAYLNSIIDTCSSFVFHAGAGYETAEKMSRIVGKDWFETYSISKRQDRFFFSINWKNNRQGMTRTGQEQLWIVDPSRFQNLSAPTAANNYCSTAMIIKKASADENFQSDKGAAVRETWMIPEAEILEDHYKPTNSEAQSIYNKNKRESTEISGLGIDSSIKEDPLLLQQEMEELQKEKNSKQEKQSSITVIEEELDEDNAKEINNDSNEEP